MNTHIRTLALSTTYCGAPRSESFSLEHFAEHLAGNEVISGHILRLPHALCEACALRARTLLEVSCAMEAELSQSRKMEPLNAPNTEQRGPHQDGLEGLHG